MLYAQTLIQVAFQKTLYARQTMTFKSYELVRVSFIEANTEVICDFNFQHKAFYIEELEDQMKKLHEDRASAIFEKRGTNNDDEMIEVEAAVKAAMSVLSRKGGNVEAARSEAQDAFAAVRKQRNFPVKLDEFGRDLNREKRMKMKVMAEARQGRRSKAFDSKKLASMEIDDHKVECESSTDESDSESQAYRSQRDLVLQAADEIFSDASEEYSQLSLVKKRMEEWKREYSSSYNDAYISLSLPLIFSPYVRLELLRWDPLHKGLDFQDMKWYKLLFTYGLPGDGKDFVHDDGDADLELVPNLVEKVALPILHYEVSHCWDILSQQETMNAIAATKLIVQHVSRESEALADLLVSIRTRLADAVANLMDIFAMSVLEKLALDELLHAKILPPFRSISENFHDAITRTERIIASLSGVWSGPSVTGDRNVQVTGIFIKCLVDTCIRGIFAASGATLSPFGSSKSGYAPPKLLMHCDQNISRSRPDFDDPNGESVGPESANMPSKFEPIPTVNESGI
ncbi:hypothetical protein TSUD_393820 [Trifolium subterraneum]|uniref:GCF C-terminal domain-containing protein n=1 Tax=Trifolium subterraneum TaxID=3900 RepID=A0A2Z6NS21_TRISU|nr:hypothetical protein TSUD_393820 [Trifolium subterraneum]